MAATIAAIEAIEVFIPATSLGTVFFLFSLLGTIISHPGSVHIYYINMSLQCPVSEAAGLFNVIVKITPLLIKYCIRIHHGPTDCYRTDIFGNK